MRAEVHSLGRSSMKPILGKFQCGETIILFHGLEAGRLSDVLSPPIAHLKPTGIQSVGNPSPAVASVASFDIVAVEASEGQPSGWLLQLDAEITATLLPGRYAVDILFLIGGGKYLSQTGIVILEYGVTQ